MCIRDSYGIVEMLRRYNIETAGKHSFRFGGEYRYNPVSYTHLDVYKRQ